MGFLVLFLLGYWATGYQTINLAKIDLSTSKPQLGAKRIVHVDLKGMPPKPSYLQELMPSLREWGATGVLLEWEDNLPYRSRLESLRSAHVLTEAAVQDVVRAAEMAGLSVIPLVPTFAKLEFMLKTREHSFLREVPNNVQVVCPSHERALAVVSELISQVLEFHPNANAIHLGGDGTEVIMRCERCKMSGSSSSELFMTHMLALVKFATNKGLDVLMWDDMVRDYPTKHLNSLARAGVQLVVRDGSPTLSADYRVLSASRWNLLQATFGPSQLWGGSAFKGADGANSDFVSSFARVQVCFLLIFLKRNGGDSPLKFECLFA